MVMAEGRPTLSTSRTFGRRAVPDPRDLLYLLADHHPPYLPALSPQHQVRYPRGPVYTALVQPVGVACALLAALHAGPGRIAPARCPTVEQLDHRAREIEGTLGQEVTLRAGCKALRDWGLISRYDWAYETEDIVAHLASGLGGLVLGLDWYAGMDHPDGTGLIRAWGPPQGGHAVFVWGLDRLEQTILIQNNWGPGWGGWTSRRRRRDFQGCARLPLEDLKKLLADNGEGVVVTKTPTGQRPCAWV
jgi:hypothetical protein